MAVSFKNWFKPEKPSKEWIDAITKLAKNKTSERFLNDSEFFAAHVARLMIGGARKETLIYSEGLKRDCYVEPLKQAQGKVRILVENMEAASWVNDLNIPSLEIRQVKDRIGEHFFVVDDESFRLEIDHENARAIGNFYEPEACTKLRQRFERAWNLGTGAG